ncbi:hypothetical protein BC830DRAFT_1147406, partial [Chytriomyces sp. MP71]
RSRVGANAVRVAVAYLDRMKARLPKSARGLPCSCHRLFLASLILAAKYINDKTYKNRSWVSFTDGLFPSSEINLMERQFLNIVDFNVSFSDADFASVSAAVNACDLRIKGILAQSVFAPSTVVPSAFEPSTPPRESTLAKPCPALSHSYLPSPATPSPIPLSMLTSSVGPAAGSHRFAPYQVPKKMVSPSVTPSTAVSPH